ncbi:hypothetical protein JVU11DRAFT_9257 [Chiua virens]|nr:hypothetical protein JVU11DRAFT_9257 [Chiua virens]
MQSPRYWKAPRFHPLPSPTSPSQQKPSLTFASSSPPSNLTLSLMRKDTHYLSNGDSTSRIESCRLFSNGSREDTGASCELKLFLMLYPTSSDQEVPGGNDDDSGTVSLLAIAQRIKVHSLKFHTNIELIAFAGKEQGLFGSKAYAPLLLMIQVDMLAYHALLEPLSSACQNCTLHPIHLSAISSLSN